MRLTSKSEYALLALVYLARHADQGCLSVHRIAEAQAIPPKFLEQILLILKRARYVRSQKGQRGGYCLARPAERIHLAEVIRLIDGAIAPTESASKHFYESTPVERERKLLRLFKEIRNYLSNTLEGTSLRDMI